MLLHRIASLSRSSARSRVRDAAAASNNAWTTLVDHMRRLDDQDRAIDRMTHDVDIDKLFAALEDAAPRHASSAQ